MSQAARPSESAGPEEERPPAAVPRGACPGAADFTFENSHYRKQSASARHGDRPVLPPPGATRHGLLDILVNNAGVSSGRPAHRDVGEEQLSDAVDAGVVHQNVGDGLATTSRLIAVVRATPAWRQESGSPEGSPANMGPSSCR